jgi:hypothetical protein
MSDIDIAAIRQRANDPVKGTSIRKDVLALLDAYEAKDSLLRVALADADAYRVARDDTQRAYESEKARADRIQAERDAVEEKLDEMVSHPYKASQARADQLVETAVEAAVKFVQAWAEGSL